VKQVKFKPMKRVLSIAFLNFREATRNKLFFGVIFFFIFYLAFCILLGRLSPGEEEKVLRNAGLVGIELTALILVIFNLIFSFYREKDSRILEVYLSDFSPSTYIAGKTVGHFLICLFYLFLSGIAYSLLLFFHRGFNLSVLAGVFAIFFKLSIVISFSLLFCCLFSSSSLALLCSLFLYAAAEAAPSALRIVNTYGDKVQRFILNALYAILPNMDKLDIKAFVVYGKLPSVEFFTLIISYTIIYLFILWLVTVLAFQKKEQYSL